MDTIGITGGAGFVGTNLVRELLREGYSVKIVDDFSTGLRSNLHDLECEIEDFSIVHFDKLHKSLEKCHYIFHLGARGSVPRSLKNPYATFEVNSRGTLNVMEVARRTGATVVFSSSSSVYGSNEMSPKHEKTWVSPMTPYAASKLTGESLVSSYAKSFGIPAITYRFFNIYGPWQRPNHNYAAVIPKWIWKLMRNEEIEIYGDGEQSRDFTFISSVLEVLVEGMKRELNHPDPINLAFGASVTLNQVIEELKQYFPQARVRYHSERIGDIRNSHNDPRLLKEKFPKITPIGFSDGLRKTISWLEERCSVLANEPIVDD